jgi:hypothetical protein
MKKVLEEVGKSLMAFANIVTALVFVKNYFDDTNDGMLVYGIYFFVATYLLSSVLIKLSERIKND